MSTQTITGADTYHWATAYLRYEMAGHHLDYDRYPIPLKSYEFLEQLDISDRKAPDGVTLSGVFRPAAAEQSPGRQMDLNLLSSILFFMRMGLPADTCPEKFLFLNGRPRQPAGCTPVISMCGLKEETKLRQVCIIVT